MNRKDRFSSSRNASEEIRTQLFRSAEVAIGHVPLYWVPSAKSIHIFPAETPQHRYGADCHHAFSNFFLSINMDYWYFALVHHQCVDRSLAGGAPVSNSASVPPASVGVLAGEQPVRERGEQSGAPGPGVQAKRPQAAREKPLPGSSLSRGRVLQRGRQQLPERAAVHTQDAVRLPRRAGEHEGGLGHLLVQDPRRDEGGPHLCPQVPPSQVFPVQQGDPSHQLQRRGHLHERSLPEGSGESNRCYILMLLKHVYVVVSLVISTRNPYLNVCVCVCESKRL